MRVMNVLTTSGIDEHRAKRSTVDASYYLNYHVGTSGELRVFEVQIVGLRYPTRFETDLITYAPGRWKEVYYVEEASK